MANLEKQKLKGLVPPRYESNEPIDLLFSQLERLLSPKNVPLSQVRVQLDLPQEIHLPLNIRGLRLKNGQILEFPRDDLFKERYDAISSLLDQLIAIKELSLQAKEKLQNKETITISLHDMKTFGLLINYIVIEGIYPSLPENVGISLEKRRINEMRKNKNVAKITIDRLRSEQQRLWMLELIVNKMLRVFDEESDVKDLLLKGIGYSDFLVCTLYLLNNPAIENKPELWTQLFELVESISNTFELYEIYTLLLNTSNSLVWFKEVCLTNLKNLPLKRKVTGVSSLIEFLSGMRYNEEVSVEKYDYVNRILLTKPKTIPTIPYFENISSQILDILVLTNRPLLTAMSVNFMEALYKRNKMICVDFFFKKVWRNFCPTSDSKSQNGVLLTGTDLEASINVLFSIVKNSSDKEFLHTLFSERSLPISLWNYYQFLKTNRLKKGQTVVFEILKLALIIMDSKVSMDILSILLDNLFIGLMNYEWVFSIRSEEDSKGIVTQKVGIVYQSYETKELEQKQKSKEELFSVLDKSVENFIVLIRELSEPLIQGLFVQVLHTWLHNTSNDPFRTLASLKLMLSMTVEFRDKLGSSSVSDILEVVETVLDKDKDKELAEPDSDDEIEDIENLSISDDSTDSVVDILYFIIDQQSAYKLLEPKTFSSLERVVKKLQALDVSNKETLAKLTAKVEELELLKASNTSDKDLALKLGRNQEKFEKDIKTFEEAMESLRSKIVPIRVHGLHLIDKLVEEKSKIVSVEDAVRIYTAELDHDDPFMFLSAVKGLSRLTEMHLEAVFPMIVSSFVESKDTATTLKIGQVIDTTLLQFENDPLYSPRGASSSLLFPKDLTQLLCHELINLVRVKETPVETEIRVSSLSLLETCFRAMLNGVREYLSDSLDLIVGIFTFELNGDPDVRKASLRLLYAIVHSFPDLENYPKGYGKNIVLALIKAAQSDQDVLVKEQASAVLSEIKEAFKEGFTGK